MLVKINMLQVQVQLTSRIASSRLQIPAVPQCFELGARSRDQLIWLTGLRHLTPLHHDNHVVVTHNLQPMCHFHDSHALQVRTQRRALLVVDADVDATGRLVQEHHAAAATAAATRLATQRNTRQAKQLASGEAQFLKPSIEPPRVSRKGKMATLVSAWMRGSSASTLPSGPRLWRTVPGSQNASCGKAEIRERMSCRYAIDPYAAVATEL